jgi:hypothetical protein
MVMAGSVLQGKGFAVSFSHREITAWGGQAPFKRLFDNVGFREWAGWGLPEPKSNRGCAPLQLIEQFIASIGCRVCRFVHVETVRMDGALARLFGWIKSTGQKAIMRLFGRFDRRADEWPHVEVYRRCFGKSSALKQVSLVDLG